ncbi:Lipase 1-like Protein [Tribolium castaneum]|uniref:Lipase 1-like Protein n=3 Tax=Tribolium castaneum TaxID=7070 RepID=D6X0Z5_TRICA|nr:PREDICTED: lipase member K [Tribolium castaneum]EFA10582.1 Lipase 1-like Protein [Tribolium castaneum]|eukprot:XP_970688.1 PREDICTED: lipase member K [Tribolium castaneum]
MHYTLFLSLNFLFIPCAFSLGLENNVCPSLIEYHIAAVNPRCYHNPDVLSDVSTVAERHGYQVEANSVTTKDGYILTVHKITSSKAQGPMKPMFIQHGIATNSGPWVDIGNRSIAFYFADKGWTVYLGNARGSTYSDKHVKLNTHDAEFWNYRLDDIAAIDIPTQLEYVFTDSGQKSVYVGHSMGTSVVFMFASQYPELASQYLERIVALAPVAYLDGAPGITLVKPVAKPLLSILELFHVWGLFHHETLIHTFLVKGLCPNLPGPCRIFLDLAFGRTSQFSDRDLLLYFSYWPSGTSIFQLKQYLQIASSKKFQMYDYGSKKNKEMYGSEDPPTYPLEDLKLPVHLFYGENDSLYRKKNMKRLYDELGSSEKTAVSAGSEIGKKFNHIDFLYSEHLIEQIYEKMEAVLGGSGGGGGDDGGLDGGDDEEEEKEEEDDKEEEKDDDKEKEDDKEEEKDEEKNEEEDDDKDD